MHRQSWLLTFFLMGSLWLMTACQSSASAVVLTGSISTQPPPLPQCQVTANLLKLCTATSPYENLLVAGTSFTPLAHNPEGDWLQVQIPKTHYAGWIPAASPLMDCGNLDIAGLPVAATGPDANCSPTPTAAIGIGVSLTAIQPGSKNITLQIERADPNQTFFISPLRLEITDNHGKSYTFDCDISGNCAWTQLSAEMLPYQINGILKQPIDPTAAQVTLSLQIDRGETGIPYVLTWQQALTPLAATTPTPALTTNLLPVEVTSPPQFELVGALGGVMKTVFAQDKYAYAGVGLQLVSLDVSDPANPRPIGRLLLPQAPTGIYAADNYAYVAHAGGVSVINIADPATPTLAGLYATPGPAVSVAGLAGADDIFVAYQRGYDPAGRSLGSGLVGVDISTPINPVEVGHYQMPETVHDLAVASIAGRLYAYLAEEGACQPANSSWVEFTCQGQVRILSLSEPSRPVEVAVFKTDRSARKVIVRDSRAYIAQCEPAGCQNLVLDVSDPAKPRTVESALPAGIDLGQVEGVFNDYLYQVDPWQGLRIVDISNPSTPTEIGAYYPPGPTSISAVKIAGNYLYAADDIRRGLAVIDRSNPAAPVEVAFIAAEPPEKIWEIHHPYLYLGEEWSELQLVDISTPTAPLLAGFYRPPDGQRVLAVADGLAYVTTPQGWQIVDLSAPAAAPVVGAYQSTGVDSWIANAAVKSGKLYSVAYEQGWQVVNWANPAAPVAQGFVALSAGMPPFIANPYAYLATPDGLQIFDLSAPTVPVELGVYQAWGAFPKVVAVRAGLALVVVDLKLHLVDVSNPAAPWEVGVYDGLRPVDAATLAPGSTGQLYAYLYSSAGRVEVLDLSNPAVPVRLGSHTLSQIESLSVSDILVAGRYAYLYDRLSGSATVVMVDIANPAEPFEVGVYQAEGRVRAVRAVPGGVEAAVLGLDSNLHLVDLSDPAAPHEVGVYDASENIIELAVGDTTTLYLNLEAGWGRQAIQRLDIANPAAPRETGRYETNPLSGWLLANGDQLFLQAGRQMVRVVDVSDPARPVEVGAGPSIPLVTSVEQLFVAESQLFLVSQRSGNQDGESSWELQGVDVSNPAAPALVGHFTPQLPALNRVLAAADGYLYFLDRRGQLRLADLSNPASPRDASLALNFGPAGYVEAADLAGDELYLGLYELGLAIFKRP